MPYWTTVDSAEPLDRLDACVAEPVPHAKGPSLNSSPDTRPTLLLRLRDAQDSLAWTQFVQVYSPLLYAFAMRRGLQDADAADVTQEVLQAVARHIGRWEYDPRSGQFRGWLFTVARNKLSDFRQKRRRTPQGSGDTDMQQWLSNRPGDETDVEAEWNREYEQRLFQWAAEQIREQFQPATWQAFWRTAVDAVEPATAAAELGISVGAVYIAKSRVLAKLRETLQEVGDP